MRYYTDIEDFARGCEKLAKNHKSNKMMPVLLEVDGIKAPFGICTEQTVNGVACLVFTGYSTLMKNITPANRAEQIRTERG